MTIRGFHHLALQVGNLEKTAVFYKEVLGLREMTRHHRPDGTLRSIWLVLGESEGGAGFLALEHNLASSVPPEGTRGYSLLALAIEQADRPPLLARLAQLGVPVEHQSRWTVYLRDPEGNRVGLSHYPADPLA